MGADALNTPKILIRLSALSNVYNASEIALQQNENYMFQAVAFVSLV